MWIFCYLWQSQQAGRDAILFLECCFVLFVLWLHATRKAVVYLSLIQVNVHTMLCQWKILFQIYKQMSIKGKLNLKVFCDIKNADFLKMKKVTVLDSEKAVINHILPRWKAFTNQFTESMQNFSQSNWSRQNFAVGRLNRNHA